MYQKILFSGIIIVFIFSCGYYLGVSQNSRIDPIPSLATIEEFKADFVRKEIASLRNASSKEEEIIEKIPPKLDSEKLPDDKNNNFENPKENVIEESYDARKEITKRLEGYNKYCEGRRRSLIGVSFITGYISRYGVSVGDVHFWTCFLPKAASSSLSVTSLLATGYLPVETKNSVATETWDKGRNSCPSSQSNCLHKYSEMPQKYRYMGSNLDKDDKFASIIVGREPMSRLVSAWKDKIYRGSDRTFYYRKVKTAWSSTNRPNCANHPTSEAAWNAGCRLEFKDFVSWVARGNQAADEHWRPAGDVCAMCSMNLSFIGHSEHYGEDAQVLADILHIPKSYLPDDYSKSNEHAAALNQNAKMASLDEFFVDLPRETLRSLKKIYEPDYLMLGYVMPTWLANA